MDQRQEVSRRKRKIAAERRRQCEANRRAKVAAIEREVDAFAAELRRRQDRELSKNPGELAEEDRERWRRFEMPEHWRGYLAFLWWRLPGRYHARSEAEAEEITRKTFWDRMLPFVRLLWRRF